MKRILLLAVLAVAWSVPAVAADPVWEGFVQPIHFNTYTPHPGLLLLASNEIRETAKKRPATVGGREDGEDVASAYAARIWLRSVTWYLLGDSRYMGSKSTTTLPPATLLDLLLRGDFGPIGMEDRQVLAWSGERNAPFQPDPYRTQPTEVMEETERIRLALRYLHERLNSYYLVYRIERDLVFDTVFLEWDRSATRFILKETKRLGKKPASFEEFLQDISLWGVGDSC